MPMLFGFENRKAGTFNKDMKAPRTKSGDISQGLKDAGMGALKMDAGKKGAGAMHTKLMKKYNMANFTTDADMGLKKDMGKSGKY